MRYEVAVETNLAFHNREFGRPIHDLPPPETVVIECEGRRFVWHVIERDPDGTDYMPTVTTMVDDPNDYDGAREAMERFLSAVAYSTSSRIEGFTSGSAGGGRRWIRRPSSSRGNG